MIGRQMLRSGRRSSLLALQVLILAFISAPFEPASAQAPANFISRLQSLPPAAQRNALRRYLYFYEQRAYPNQQIPAGAMERARRDHEQKFGALRSQLTPGAALPAFNQNQWTPIGPS